MSAPVRITDRPQLAVPDFSQSEMQTFARTAIAEEYNRTARGINADDLPARPLGAKYAKLKQARGREPIRDLRLTGAMMASRGILESGPNAVAVGFADPRSYLKAAVNEALEPMLGISPHDEQIVDALIHRVFDGHLETHVDAGREQRRDELGRYSR
jgi:hypothetical protein